MLANSRLHLQSLGDQNPSRGSALGEKNFAVHDIGILPGILRRYNFTSMGEKPQPTGTVRFGTFELDLAAGELRKNGRKVRLARSD